MGLGISPWVRRLSFHFQSILTTLVQLHFNTSKEGGIEVTLIRGRRPRSFWMTLRKQTRYWKLKSEVPGRILWRTRFGKGYEPVERKNME
jgi:hypothetical protein